MDPNGDVPGAVITISNRHAQDLKVYLWAAPGSRWRLGTAPAKTTTAFKVLRLFWGVHLRLVLQPWADPGGEFTTDAFWVEPGGRVEVQTDVVLHRSMVVVR